MCAAAAAGSRTACAAAGAAAAARPMPRLKMLMSGKKLVILWDVSFGLPKRSWSVLLDIKPTSDETWTMLCFYKRTPRWGIIIGEYLS